ncbi:tryptophan synthase subunit alpha, partial [Acinetobacter baumannii]
RTQVPVCVGFGVRTPEQVKQLSTVADGVVVGSSLVQLIADTWPAGRQAVVDYVRSLTEATRG